MSPSSFNLLILLLSSISIPTAISDHRHIITIPSTIPRPSCFAWDPTAQHFVLASSSLPSISSISDASLAETIIVSDPLISAISSISVDDRRRRLLVAAHNPDSVAAYDLRSPRPHRRIFSSSLPSSPAGIALDPSTGSVFVTGSERGRIWKVDSEGIVSDFSRSVLYEGLDGVAHARNGFLLVVQGKTGRVLKVDEENGAAKEVIGRNGKAAAAEAEGIAVMGDGAAVVGGGRRVRMVASGDGWAEMAVKGEVRVEEGERIRAVAVREGKRAYVLVTQENDESGDCRIEEVEWEEEGDMLWLMVIVGFGLAYFLYWRFQMRKMLDSMNKKMA